MTEMLNLGEALHRILDQYPSPKLVGKDRKYDTVDSDPELQKLVTQTAKTATNEALGDRASELHVRPTMGQGAMGDIPYIPIQIPTETQTTQKGIYVVYLFDTEAKTLYLTLNQGSVEAERASGCIGGPPYKKEILRKHAEMYRDIVDCPSQFIADQTDLTETVVVDGEEETVNRAADYNAGSVFYCAYNLEDLGAGATDELTKDLHAILDTYETLLDRLYSVPEFESDATIWKISPEGGKDAYWKTWRQEGIASIGYSKEAEFDRDERVDHPPEPHNSPERMAYNMQKGISVGDIVIAGAPKSKIDVTFGVGRVTKDYYDTMEEYDDPAAIGPDEFDHDVFVSVDWHVFHDSGIAFNCLKESSAKKSFHNWTVEDSNARLDHFVGAVARRMTVQELTDSEESAIKGVTRDLELTRTDGGRPVTEVENKASDEDEEQDQDTPATYSEWWEDHTHAIESAGRLGSPDHLVFSGCTDEEILSRVRSALVNGKHIILTGPPGTGKTKLARHIARHYVDDKHEMVTATADWSTFDTIGGFRPQADRELRFHSGVFLDRFHADEEGTPQTEWLIIDELNRADIDKAFGSLLSALTGETIQLPFETGDEPITLIGDPRSDDERVLQPNHYFIPKDWRLIGTMNTYDKTSLYQLSYAFMRRFAFIPVSVPSIESIDGELIQEYAEEWFEDTPNDEIAVRVADLWTRINEVRSIGPAIVRDILADIRTNERADITDPLIMYVMPQLEGLSKSDQRKFVANMQSFNEQQEDGELVDIQALEEFVLEYFGVEVDESKS